MNKKLLSCFLTIVAILIIVSGVAFGETKVVQTIADGKNIHILVIRDGAGYYQYRNSEGELIWEQSLDGLSYHFYLFSGVREGVINNEDINIVGFAGDNVFYYINPFKKAYETFIATYHPQKVFTFGNSTYWVLSKEGDKQALDCFDTYSVTTTSYSLPNNSNIVEGKWIYLGGETLGIILGVQEGNLVSVYDMKANGDLVFRNIFFAFEKVEKFDLVCLSEDENGKGTYQIQVKTSRESVRPYP